MPLQRITMWLTTSTDAANAHLIATGAKLASAHGAELNAIVTTPLLSRSGHWALGVMISTMAAELESRAERTAAEIVRDVDLARSAAGLAGSTMTQALAPYEFGDFVAQRSRTSDLVLAAAAAEDEARSELEALIFAAARPVLLLPHAQANSPDRAFSFDKIAVAWDGSRTATRAVHDALPLLQRATETTLIQIADDKDLTRSETLGDLGALLARHGVKTKALEVRGGGKPTAVALKDAFRQSGADILVMGAYGHSRAREFILGGATLGLLKAHDFPLLLSH